MSKKGKGLSQDEYSRFIVNEETWNNGFLNHIKSLTDEREREFAQIKRKYQSSFVEIEPFHARFTHKFSNPSEVHEYISPLVKKSGLLHLEVLIPDNFDTDGCIFKILNDEITDVFKEVLQVFFNELSKQYKSLFYTMKYIDNHMQIISGKAIDKIRERKEEIEKQKQIEEEKKQPIEEEKEENNENEAENNEIQEINNQNINLRKESRGTEKSEDYEEDYEEDKEEFKDETNKETKQRRRKFEMRDRAVLNIIAQALTFKNYSSGALQSCILDVQCMRCQSISSLSTTQGEFDIKTGTNSLLGSGECQCTLILQFTIFPIIMHQLTDLMIATSNFVNCKPVDFRESSFKFTCADCGAESALLNIAGFNLYTENCTQCFKKQSFRIQGIDFLSERPDKKNEGENKEKFIGKPLPKNGTCKHFSQSYRWFKYNCCQKIFPCSTCHDAISDHKSSSADYYVCGFCGMLQPIGKESCGRCKAAVTKAGDPHQGNNFWEGGKGCRNKAQLSHKDKRKYHKKK
ncbi:unnamed protein product [Blepharisma stoltei]|uniref:CHY-type domain-containing protein n=1 Tax=Blepharisma stoltei TaxID=1481888 RepID=A0AAU9JHR4_9CILI|nr:unnamed protein product [Blepharisma stoltei]